MVLVSWLWQLRAPVLQPLVLGVQVTRSKDPRSVPERAHKQALRPPCGESGRRQPGALLWHLWDPPTHPTTDRKTSVP